VHNAVIAKCRPNRLIRRKAAFESSDRRPPTVYHLIYRPVAGKMRDSQRVINVAPRSRDRIPFEIAVDSRTTAFPPPSFAVSFPTNFSRDARASPLRFPIFFISMDDLRKFTRRRTGNLQEDPGENWRAMPPMRIAS